MTLKKFLTWCQLSMDKALDQMLPPSNKKPSIIHEAMRYSVFAGGKRLRPALVIAGAQICGGRFQDVKLTACALELIHTYSLIHDDLPAMDDDDLRRGKPTNHIKFGEDIAILAGDALLTHAFLLIAENARRNKLSSNNFSKLIKIICHGAGTEGMIGGQVADIQSDKGRWKKMKGVKNHLEYIHLHKTSALIQASLVSGAILSGANDKQISALNSFGENLGMAFQIKDDILDKIGDKNKLGKKGSDITNQKLTYLSLHGLSLSEKMAQNYADKSIQTLSIFGNKCGILKELTKFVISRDH